MANPSEITSHPLEEETPKKVKTTKSVFNEDLISRLPDQILANILSFIPTKTAVATSVLSKRWIRIWISVPNLDFSLDCTSIYCSPSPVKKALFLDFFDRVLSLNNVLSVRKVIFYCTFIDCELSRVKAWISSLFRRDAEKILIKLPIWHLVKNCEGGSLFSSVPDCFFNQNNLVDLMLQGVVLKVPSSVWFPKLKIIKFCTVQLPDDHSIKNLLSGCPVLWSLTIYGGIFENAQVLYFCSYSLKQLNLLFDNCGRDFGYGIVIDAPNLTHLDLTDEVGMNYNAIKPPSLLEVTVRVLDNYEGRFSGIDYGKRLFDLFTKITHVKKLTLIGSYFPVLSLEDMPMFHKLTRLKVQVFGYNTWSILAQLFHCIPNLVTLILDLGEEGHPDCVWYENEPLDVPQCYSSSIEFVDISGFTECEEEMGMIIYILKNAMVLKKLSITSYKLDLVQETNILKSLLMLPRSSSACVIEYENDCTGEDHSW